LSSNSAITAEFIKKNIDKPWDWGECGLSRNPAIFRKRTLPYTDELVLTVRYRPGGEGYFEAQTHFEELK